MQDLGTALALVLVIEGIVLALAPDGVKRAALQMTAVPSSALRLGGLAAHQVHDCQGEDAVEDVHADFLFGPVEHGENETTCRSLSWRKLASASAWER